MSDVPVLDLEVFVPSRSRWERSLTLEALQGQWDGVALVVPADQARQYKPLAERHGARLTVCPSQYKGIAGTRQFIGKIARNKFLMLDDDLRFYRRKSVEDWQLHMFGKHDMSAMLILVNRLLDHYAHVGIGPRQFNVKYSTHIPKSGVKPEPHKYPWYLIGRPLRALAYRKGPFLKCEHGRVAIMEDFDVTLQLLRKGYRNAIITQYAQDQPQTQAAGGCSDYRTHKLHEENVRKMAKLHPGLVSIVQKKNKTGGEFGHRVEAMIQWEKAWKQGMAEIVGT
jgi:hypothetical protein